MTHKVEAVYQNGVLRPLDKLAGIAENARVRLTIEDAASTSDGIRECFGTMPADDADELAAIIDREFEQINPDDWR